MAFYNQTLLAVKAGVSRMHELQIPTRRPADFFCEHVKTDAHMARIKDRLLLEEKKMSAFEQRKQREQTRKFSKQVSDLRRQEKARATKDAVEEVSRLRKSGGADKEGRLLQLVEGKGGGRQGGGRGDGSGKSSKRQAMDKKYGFGAKERMRSKLNDKKSLNDLRDYSPRGGKFVRREGKGRGSSGGGKAGGGAKVGGKRPGKAARAAARAGRSASA